MSVLKSKRTESKAEYVNVANAIYIETINFLTRISARYSRLITEPVAKLAGEVIDHAEKANSIYPSDDQRRQLRKAHLLEARASLMALAGKRTLQEVAQYMNCQEAYYKNFDDHGRLLRLRRLCYAIFGGRVPCSKSSKPVMAPSLP